MPCYMSCSFKVATCKTHSHPHTISFPAACPSHYPFMPFLAYTSSSYIKLHTSKRTKLLIRYSFQVPPVYFFFYSQPRVVQSPLHVWKWDPTWVLRNFAWHVSIANKVEVDVGLCWKALFLKWVWKKQKLTETSCRSKLNS